MPLTFFMGTRPEAIKLDSLLKEALSRNLDFEFVHTGQHYDWEMSMQYIKDLNLPEPDVFLSEEKGDAASNVGRIFTDSMKYLKKNIPKAVVVLGDTNSTLGVALATCKLGVPLVHVEAGCRSFDWSMPEEKNRVIVSDCADINFAPTERCVRNLKSENIRGDIVLSGHPLVKTVHSIAENTNDKEVLESFRLQPKSFFLVTFHRVENVDSKSRLQHIIKVINSMDKKVVFPMHPRTRLRLKEFDLSGELDKGENLVLTPPLSYRQTLSLVKNAFFVVTDSGGLQQEAYLLETPCITVRESIPWGELAEAGVTVNLDPTRRGFAEFFKTLDLAYHVIKAKFQNTGQIFGADDVPKNIIDRLCLTYDL